MSGVGFQVAGDLGLTADGTDFVLVTSDNATLQEIRLGATVFVGLWTYDAGAGLDYLTNVFVKGPSTAIVRTMFATWLLARTGVIEIVKLDVVFDARRRAMHVDFAVRLQTGAVISDRLPFVVVPAQ